LPCGESLIRQILYGKSYFLEKFNVDIKVAWLPDSFGFNWQLPQILIKSGFRYFVTQKLSWNDTTKFPYHIFYWRGVDGSQILSYFTNLIGDDINPITIIEHLEQLQKEHQLNHTLWLYGVGDHGGGPTADMLNIARCWQKSDLFPQIKHTRIVDYLELLEKTVAPEIIPTWHDELYLEFHRGTYTTKADQKRQNRSIELLLLNLEKIATIHSLLGQSSYPTDLFNRAWKLVLVNQFHDIITGTSIPEVFAEANQDWQTVREIGDRVLREIHSDPLTNSSDLVLSNLYGWDTQQLVEIDLNKYPQPPNSWLSANYQISEGKIYLIANVPAFSWIDINSLAVNTIKRSSNVLNLDENDHEFLLENQYLLVTISKLSGEITQIHDKRYNHNVLRQPIHWQFFDDRGQYWDAWNIDPEYEKKLLPAPILVNAHLKIVGHLLIVVETVHQFRNSQFTQQIQLNSIDPFLTVTNFIDWQEEYTLAKIAFPVNFSCNYATYEIPMAVIQRAVDDPVKWEVPAQFWADLSASTIGLSIINDCKYGYSAKADQISLTALRSPQWTCKDSDRGVHKFSYRLLPHAGCWRKAQTVKLAQEFNNPLFPMRCNSPSTDSLVRISAEQIVISAWKQSHDQNGWIFRCYEAHGETAEVSITFNDRLRITKISECNLMEQGFLPATFDAQHFTLTCKFKPFEIKTFYLHQSE
jgi:alpha-mannosidase